MSGAVAPMQFDAGGDHAPPRAADAILPLRVRGLRYAAGGSTLIDGLDLDLEAGPRSVIVGPNGAGKSLLLRLLHGLLRPGAGSISWAGAPPGRRVRMRQAMVFQKPVLLRRSVLANVTHALRVQGIRRGERRERAREVLDQAGLASLAGRPARVLSGGEQQRLAIARAWAVRPEVMLLDEPTASLDPAATLAVERMIAAIHAAGTKIVMTTHDMGQARRLADEVLFLHRGRLVERAPAATFFDEPESREARTFLAGQLLV